MPKAYKIVGFDPSLNNWGFSIATLNQENTTYSLTIDRVGIIQPNKPEFKRQNQKDLYAGNYLYSYALPLCEGADFIIAELPIGSQSSRAMVSYAMCLGILGSIQSHYKDLTQFIWVNPDEVKKASVGSKTASKSEIINWAISKHPEANFPTKTVKGQTTIVEGKAEHMADSIAAIYAGLPTVYTYIQKD